MREDMLWDGLVYGHEHRRPDDTVEANDVLAYDMILGRPATSELCCRFRGALPIADRCHIVQQRIEPYVGDVLRIKWNANPPVEACPRD